jgi:hypothetical protein
MSVGHNIEYGEEKYIWSDLTFDLALLSRTF